MKQWRCAQSGWWSTVEGGHSCQFVSTQSVMSGGGGGEEEGRDDSPAWPCESAGSSGRSGGRGTAGPSGASSERGTAVSRRSSGMWPGSGGRRAQRDLLCSTIMQQGQRTGTEYIISCPSSSPLCRATERTLWRPVTHSLKSSLSKKSKNPPDRIYSVWFL